MTVKGSVWGGLVCTILGSCAQLGGTGQGRGCAEMVWLKPQWRLDHRQVELFRRIWQTTAVYFLKQSISKLLTWHSSYTGWNFQGVFCFWTSKNSSEMLLVTAMTFVVTLKRNLLHLKFCFLAIYGVLKSWDPVISCEWLFLLLNKAS